MEAFPVAEMAGQQQGGLVADVADAESEQQPLERDRAAGVDAGDEVPHAGLPIAVLGAEGVELFRVAGETEDVGGLVDPTAFVEGGQLFLAQTFDVEGAAGDKMLEPFDQLGGADQPAGAATANLALRPHGLRTADRAVGREDVGEGVGGAFVGDHRDDLGDDVAGALQDHGVADAHVLARDLVLVVQGGVADHDAADGDGRKAGDGGEGAGAADLDVDAFQHGGRLLRRKFVRDGPAGAAGDEAEAVLPVEAVNLVDHAVDVIAELRAIGFEAVIDADQSIGALDAGRARIDREAPGFERLQRLGLRPGEWRRGLAPGVGEEAQGAPGRHRRVDLAQRSGGEVAGVGVGATAGRLGLRVEGGEGVVGGIDFAAHLDQGGPAGALQPVGNVGDGLQIGGDVLARPSVAAGRALDQNAVFVAQVGAETVDLGFGDEGDDLIRGQLEEAHDAGDEIGDVAVVESIVEGQHGHAVSHLGELAGDGCADPPRG